MQNRTRPTSAAQHEVLKNCKPSYRDVMTQRPNVAAGKVIVNWDLELLALKRNPEDKHRWKKLRVAAASWVTCACGEQCATIPRDLSGKPKDKELTMAGLKFNFAIEAEDRAEARHWLNIIEQRSADLIKEINLTGGATNG